MQAIHRWTAFGQSAPAEYRDRCYTAEQGIIRRDAVAMRIWAFMTTLSCAARKRPDDGLRLSKRLAYERPNTNKTGSSELRYVKLSRGMRSHRKTILRMLKRDSALSMMDSQSPVRRAQCQVLA
jgi:hypothetical protein